MGGGWQKGKMKEKREETQLSAGKGDAGSF
jgi:hypothetical protein